MTIDKEFFSDRLLKVLGLLVGLQFLTASITFFTAFLPMGDYYFVLISNQQFISNGIFGFILYTLISYRKQVALPLATLSLFSPLFASILYLLSTIDDKNN